MKGSDNRMLSSLNSLIDGRVSILWKNLPRKELHVSGEVWRSRDRESRWNTVRRWTLKPAQLQTVHLDINSLPLWQGFLCSCSIAASLPPYDRLWTRREEGKKTIVGEKEERGRGEGRRKRQRETQRKGEKYTGMTPTFIQVKTIHCNTKWTTFWLYSI